MAITTWVATFVVDNGRVTEEGHRLRSFHRRRLDEPDVDLHVLHEPFGTRGEDLGTQAIDAIGRIFLNDRLSLTGALTRSLSETHQTLLEWNRRSLPRDQVGIGITAALVGGNIVYLAQIGPSLVYLKRGNTLSRLYPADQAARALGEGSMDPSLRRIELQEDDLLMASSVALGELLGPEDMREILGHPAEDVLPELYLRTRDLPAFALFAITGVVEEDEEEVSSEEEDGNGRHPADPTSPSLEQAQPASTASVRNRAAHSFGLDPDLFRDPAPAKSDGPTLVYPPVRNPVDISRPVVNLRNDRNTGRNAYARTTGEGRFKFNLSDARLIQIAAVVAVVLILVIFVPDLVREGRSERLTEFIQSAQLHLAAAEDEQDPGQRRFYLEESRRLATEALRIDETNAEAIGLRGQANLALQEMNAVFDISPMTSLVTLSGEITGSISVTALTVHAGLAYMLDSAGGRVIAMPLDRSAPPAIVYQDGETYGDAPGRTPTHFAWEGSEEDGRLLILDAERKLFELRPGARPQLLPLRRTSTWASVAGMEVYDGNLYILDPAGDQVHRYRPAAEGYDSEPQAILAAGMELANAVDFSVDADIYVVYSDGRVARFHNGSPAAFPLGGIDRAITAATDIHMVSHTGEIYIADTGNKRVVIAGREGSFRRQLIANAMTDLSAIATDVSGQQLYVVVSDQLLTAPVVR